MTAGRIRPVPTAALCLSLLLAALVPLPAAAGDLPVTGRVVDPGGRAVPGARVLVLPLQRMELLRDPAAWKGRTATTKKDGSFRLTVPAGRPFRLEVRAHGFPRARVDRPGAEGPGPLDAGEIRLDPGARVSLVPVDREDRPVTEVPFELEVRGTDPRETVTLGERDGEWREERLVVSGLAAGTRHLVLRAGGYAAADLGEVDLAAGKTVDLGKVVLRRGPAIEGIVYSPSGEPLPGVQVQARAAGPGSGEGETRKKTRTRGDGRFLLGGLVEGATYTVSVLPDEGAPWEGEARPGDRLEVHLPRPGEIAGRAVIAGEGTPATPLVVRYHRLDQKPRSAGGGFPGAAAAPWLDERRTFREGDGTFRLADLAPGTYRLVIEHPGALPFPVERVEVEAGGKVDLGTIRLSPGLELSGRVVDAATGEPVAGAVVERVVADPFLALRGKMGALLGEPEEAVRTDGRGRFTVGGLEPGRVVLEARADGYAPRRVEATLEEGRNPEPVRVELSSGGAVEGMVRRPDGSPAAGVQVLVMRDMVPDLDHSTETDAAGRYRIEHLPPGPITLVAMLAGPGAKGFDPSGLHARSVTIRAGKTVRADIPEGSGGVTLTGRVLAGGEPVSARLIFFREGSGMIPAEVDDGGRYRVVLPSPGTWRVGVVRLASGENDGEDPGSSVSLATAEASVEVPPGVPAATREIRLPSAEVRGTVRDPEGNPVAGALVALRPGEETGKAPAGAAAPISWAEDDGSFRLRWVPEGSWVLAGSAPGHAWQETDPFEVGRRGTVRADLVLPAANPVSVRVADPTGNPVAGARLVALESPLPGPAFARGAVTDEEGRVRLDTLPDGTWHVAAVSDRFGVALGEVAVPAPEGAVQEITFEPTVPVTLLVRDGSGRPVAGARLVAGGPAGGPEASPALGLAAFLLGRTGGLRSDGEGRIDLPPLPPGKWDVRVRCPGREGDPVPARIRVAGMDPLEVEVSCPDRP